MGNDTETSRTGIVHLARLLQHAKHVTVLTGAGMSTESGPVGVLPREMP